MPVSFPSLFETRLSAFSFCLWFPSDTPGLVEALGEPDARRVESCYGEGAQTCYVRFTTGRFPGGEFHCHVDIARGTNFRSPPSNLVPLAEILNGISPFIGERGDGWLRGHYVLASTEVAANGIVNSLSGLRLEIGGESLVLSGAKMSFEGDEFDELTWDLKEDRVEGNLDADLDSHLLTDQSFADEISRLEAGVDRFLIERD